MDKKSLIGILIILFLFIGVIFYNSIANENLLTNGLTVQAKVLSYNTGVKSKGNFQCQIIYDGKVLELMGNSSINYGVLNYVGKTFPAKFSPKYNKLQLLITPRDFEKFDMSFPDSLNWVINLITK